MLLKATYDDMPEILRCSKEFYQTTHYQNFADFNDDDVENVANIMINDGILNIWKEGDKILGMVGLITCPFFFNTALKMACEVIWYLDKSIQGQGIGQTLLLSIEPSCKELNVNFIHMLVLESSPEHAGKMYEKMGYKLTELTYYKELI